MKPPAWKNWLSQIMEIHIESTSSEYNPHLYVSLRRGRYQLSTAKAIYSYADLYNNFVKAFQSIELDKIPGQEVLVLGLGLGSIPIILEKTMQRRFFYTAVEVDEAVIDLASRYSLPNLESPIEIICADAYAFVMQSETQYDLICMDVFIDDTIPSPFEEPEFVKQLKNLLSPGGIILYNRLTSQPKHIRKTLSFFKNTFLPLFPDGTYINARGNWILLNEQNLLKTDLEQLDRL